MSSGKWLNELFGNKTTRLNVYLTMTVDVSELMNMTRQQSTLLELYLCEHANEMR